jgi:hypothetical protein
MRLVIGDQDFRLGVQQSATLLTMHAALQIADGVEILSACRPGY